jgi:hypothetical protein
MRISRILRIRLLLALGLLVALGVPSWIALSAQRSERGRREQTEDAARLLLAQRMAAETERSVRDLRRATVLLASDRQIRTLFATPSEAERQLAGRRLAEAAGVLGVTSLQLHDGSGRVFLSVTGGGSDVADEATASPDGDAARIALHAPVTDDDGAARGQLVASVPIDAVVEGIDMAELGTGSVNMLDGRILMDAEGPRKGIVLDVVSTQIPRHPLRDAGIGEAAPGQGNVAFALVPSVPLLVTIAARAPVPAPTNPLLLIDGALLAFGLLGVFGIAYARPIEPHSA